MTLLEKIEETIIIKNKTVRTQTTRKTKKTKRTEKRAKNNL